MIKPRFYLPNLNAVRAIAALMVIVSHVERKMSFFDIAVFKPITKLGSIGVTLFFALSGFLITYLLLLEKDKFEKINIKDFYVRRFLRIWPLYFLVLFFVYVLIPYISPDYFAGELERFTLKSALLNVFFLTNVTIVLKYTPLIISVIWSIGIEEQFYLFWPWLMKSKNKVKFIVAIILLLPILKILCLLFVPNFSVLNNVYEILNHTRFDSMAIGGFFGILAFNKKIAFKNIIISCETFKSKKNQIGLYILTISLLFFSLSNDEIFNLYNFQILPIFFSIMILNLIDAKSSVLNLENKIINYVGRISYSLYLLHVIVFYFLFPYLKRLFLNIDNSVTILLVYIVSILASIIVSAMSYEILEKRFLKYKKYFSHIKTQ